MRASGRPARGALRGLPSCHTFGESGAADGGGDAASGSDATSSGDATSGGDANPGFDAPTEGSANPLDGSGGFDSAALDANVPDALATFTIGTAGSMTNAVGYGYQLHVVYAENDAHYWLFFADGTAEVIRTRFSSDFVTWSDGASISLTAGYNLIDGNSFSVAYANLGGHDVVHIVENSVAGGSNYGSFHIRATIAGGVITASTPVALPDTDSAGGQGSSAGSCTTDGPAAVIGSDGHAWDVTAWTGHSGATTCDTNIYESPAVDTGGTWNNGAFIHDGYYVSLPTYDFAHELVALPDAGLVMIVYPDYDDVSVTLFDSMGWALSTTFDGGGPGSTGVGEGTGAELFTTSGNQASYDDWAVCRLTDGDVHVLRHALTTPGTAGIHVGPFQEVVYDGSSWSTVASPPTDVTSLTNTGVVLVSDTNPDHGMLAAVIGTDNAIHVAKLTTASGWTWVTSIPGAVVRQSLAGSGCGSRRPALIWTEGNNPPYAIMAADLSGLL